MCGEIDQERCETRHRRRRPRGGRVASAHFILFLLGFAKPACFLAAIYSTWWAWLSKCVLFTILGERAFHFVVIYSTWWAWFSKLLLFTVVWEREFTKVNKTVVKNVRNATFEGFEALPKSMFRLVYAMKWMILKGVRNIKKSIIRQYLQWFYWFCRVPALKP